jgi:hypothetical protein
MNRKLLLGYSHGYAAGACVAFRTVSLGTFVNKVGANLINSSLIHRGYYTVTVTNVATSRYYKLLTT